MIWELSPGVTPEHLGILPGFLSELDPDPAWKQIDKNYGHGGGWRPFQGHVLQDDMSLKYPEDPPLHPLAHTKLRDEIIVFYECEWLVIIQPDGSYEVARVD